MKVLYLETSSKNCSVAIFENEKLLCLCEELSPEGYHQAEKLHLFVQWALQGAGVELKDLDFIGLGIGPGSYTGLRIGAASAKGFAFALEKPLIGVDSLFSMVEPFVNQGFDYIIPLIDARRNEVYTAVFSGENAQRIASTQSLILEENSFEKYAGHKILFVGDGAKKAQEILKISAEYKENVYPSAKFLHQRGKEKILQKDFEDLAYFEPLYLKEFQGEKMKK